MLLHGKLSALELDRNEDGFLDQPMNENIILHNQWNFTGEKFRMEFGAGALRFSSLAGKGVGEFQQIKGQDTITPYEVSSITNRGQAFAKIGYLFPNEDYKSLAIQFSGVYHNHESHFGNRNYTGNQQSGYVNFIFQDELDKKDISKFRTGFSVVYDSYQESLQNHDSTVAQQYNLEEIDPGVYYEYSATMAR